MPPTPRVLFILKKRDVPFYDVRQGAYSTSSGLFNSARCITDMLVTTSADSKLVEVVDNNCIDREVTQYQPTHVVIEAFWVVPEKFEVLVKLHPSVTWIVRAHSDIPFLANEGIAMEWIFKYLDRPNVKIAFNSEKALGVFRDLAMVHNEVIHRSALNKKVIFLPNYYPSVKRERVKASSSEWLDVSCFGAIRPLKNQLIQATAAILYADKHERKLRFHINGSRLEQKGDPVVKNIRQLFATLPPDRYQLVEHEWYAHEDFLKVAATMDLCLQVSFTETFNIVAADHVTCGVPVVVSKEIEWTDAMFQAECTDVYDIVDKMEMALWWKARLGFFDLNLHGLKRHSKIAKDRWLRALTE